MNFLYKYSNNETQSVIALIVLILLLMLEQVSVFLEPAFMAFQYFILTPTQKEGLAHTHQWF